MKKQEIITRFIKQVRIENYSEKTRVSLERFIKQERLQRAKYLNISRCFTIKLGDIRT